MQNLSAAPPPPCSEHPLQFYSAENPPRKQGEPSDSKGYRSRSTKCGSCCHCCFSKSEKVCPSRDRGPHSQIPSVKPALTALVRRNLVESVHTSRAHLSPDQEMTAHSFKGSGGFCPNPQSEHRSFGSMCPINAKEVVAGVQLLSWCHPNPGDKSQNSPSPNFGFDRRPGYYCAQR